VPFTVGFHKGANLLGSTLRRLHLPHGWTFRRRHGSFAGQMGSEGSSVNASPLSAVENKAESGGKESRVLVGSMVQAYRHRCPILNAPHSSTRCSFNSGLPMTSAID
jgi:hypothetical protein